MSSIWLQSNFMYFYFLFQLGNRTILRIVLHGLGSPLWGDEHYRPDTINPSLTQFLFQLRAVMRSALAVCLITIPTHLFQVRGLRRFKYKLLCLIIPLYLETFNSLSYRNVKKMFFSCFLSFFPQPYSGAGLDSTRWETVRYCDKAGIFCWFRNGNESSIQRLPR